MIPISDDLLMVEDGSPRVFCKEKCIEEFYSPLVHYYKQVERSIRNEYGLLQESCIGYASQPEYLEKAFTKPDEIWRLKNDLGEEVYSFMARMDGFSIIILCLVFDHRPSFVFLTTATADPRLIRDFQIGEKLKNIEDFHEKAKNETGSLEIDQDAISTLESKKSTLLAGLLERRLPTDIDFELFPVYQQFYRETLEKPDEIYRWTDNEGDELYSYIKVHDSKGISFYYIVICIGKLASQLLPVLSFPTLDPALYNAYKKGQLITGKLKN